MCHTCVEYRFDAERDDKETLSIERIFDGEGSEMMIADESTDLPQIG
jgi:hypothetical protein